MAYPNLDLTVHLFTEPRTEWLGFDTSVSFGGNGIGFTHSILHDGHGPIGAISQILTVRPRDGSATTTAYRALGGGEPTCPAMRHSSSMAPAPCPRTTVSHGSRARVTGSMNAFHAVVSAAGIPRCPTADPFGGLRRREEQHRRGPGGRARRPGRPSGSRRRRSRTAAGHRGVAPRRATGALPLKST